MKAKVGDWIAFTILNGMLRYDCVLYVRELDRYPFGEQYVCAYHLTDEHRVIEVREAKKEVPNE